MLTEAIENEFVPVLIYNNKSSDAGMLKRFNEPSWNNPVVRYLDANGKDVIPRADGQWATGNVARQMIAALKASKRKVPNSLILAAMENPSAGRGKSQIARTAIKQATFAMF